MTEKSDREFLKEVNLQEGLAAELLGKSRQAINHGLREDVYFKPHELGVLLSYCRSNMPASVPAIEHHITATRDRRTSERIRSSYGSYLTEDDILHVPSIWMVAPDMRYFRTAHSDQLAWVLARAARDMETFVLVASNEADAARFWEDFDNTGAKASVVAKDEATRVYSTANALPYCAFMEPSSNPTNCWVLGLTGFQKIDSLRADSMLQFLRSPDAIIGAPEVTPQRRQGRNRR